MSHNILIFILWVSGILFQQWKGAITANCRQRQVSHQPFCLRVDLWLFLRKYSPSRSLGQSLSLFILGPRCGLHGWLSERIVAREINSHCIVLFILICHLNGHFQISQCHYLMKGLFLFVRNFHSKIIQHWQKRQTHRETLCFSFFGRGWGSAEKGEKNRKGQRKISTV